MPKKFRGGANEASDTSREEAIKAIEEKRDQVLAKLHELVGSDKGDENIFLRFRYSSLLVNLENPATDRNVESKKDATLARLDTELFRLDLLKEVIDDLNAFYERQGSAYRVDIVSVLLEKKEEEVSVPRYSFSLAEDTVKPELSSYFVWLASSSGDFDDNDYITYKKNIDNAIKKIEPKVADIQEVRQRFNEVISEFNNQSEDVRKEQYNSFVYDTVESLKYYVYDNDLYDKTETIRQINLLENRIKGKIADEAKKEEARNELEAYYQKTIKEIEALKIENYAIQPYELTIPQNITFDELETLLVTEKEKIDLLKKVAEVTKQLLVKAEETIQTIDNFEHIIVTGNKNPVVLIPRSFSYSSEEPLTQEAIDTYKKEMESYLASRVAEAERLNQYMGKLSNLGKKYGVDYGEEYAIHIGSYEIPELPEAKPEAKPEVAPNPDPDREFDDWLLDKWTVHKIPLSDDILGLLYNIADDSNNARLQEYLNLLEERYKVDQEIVTRRNTIVDKLQKLPKAEGKKLAYDLLWTSVLYREYGTIPYNGVFANYKTSEELTTVKEELLKALDDFDQKYFGNKDKEQEEPKATDETDTGKDKEDSTQPETKPETPQTGETTGSEKEPEQPKQPETKPEEPKSTDETNTGKDKETSDKDKGDKSGETGTTGSDKTGDKEKNTQESKTPTDQTKSETSGNKTTTTTVTTQGQKATDTSSKMSTKEDKKVSDTKSTTSTNTTSKGTKTSKTQLPKTGDTNTTWLSLAILPMILGLSYLTGRKKAD